MKIIEIEIEKIKPYDKNPRRNQSAISKVANAIKEFGFQQPIVVDKSYVIIAGHTRHKAALKLGLRVVPILIAETLTDAQVRAYRLADNRVAQEASWNENLLKLELEELLDLDFDLDLTGFNIDELNKLLNPEIIKEEPTSEDDSKNIKSKIGDIYILGNHRLMCGDSTNPEHVDQLIDNNFPVLMVTDPPYGVDYDPKWRQGKDLNVGKRATGNVLNDNRSKWAEAYALFTGDVAYIWHAARFAVEVAQDLNDLNYQLITQIIWVKQHFVISRGDYHWQHEPCWYAVKNNKRHNWKGSRKQSTVWNIANNNSWGNQNHEETLGHATQKPVECMLRPINNNSSQNDYIYDPFGGSGTTLIACEQSKRRGLMMELSPVYCDMIVKRWEKFTGKSAELIGAGGI